jgi:hypothetical protein
VLSDGELATRLGSVTQVRVSECFGDRHPLHYVDLLGPLVRG